MSGHHDAHTIQDDMESFFYVMLYFGLRYLKHNCARDVSLLLKFIFDYEEVDIKGSVLGGYPKISLITNFNEQLGDNFKFSSSPFQIWFEWTVKAIGEWIRHCKLTTSQRAEATQGAESKPLFYDHSNMAQVFAQCLDSQDWPTDEPRPIDAAAGADGGTTRTLKRPFDSEYVDEDGSIGGSRKQSRTKQSRTSNAAGSRGGSHQANKQSTSRTSGSRVRGLHSQQVNEQSTSGIRGSRGGSRGGSNSKRSMQSTSRHSMTTRSRAGSSHGG
ncbi:hypothetical protein C0993_010299 [Termitomyces sp. T159_Od127]|nr:hypothetical protein C0993_010299 [Termitomyces sp. T159_Od127]